MISRLMISALLLLTGCAADVWMRPPGVDEPQFFAEEYACFRDSEMIPSGGSQHMGWITWAQKEQLYERCMAAKGYRRP